jgi:invasion protein IalB
MIGRAAHIFSASRGVVCVALAVMLSLALSPGLTLAQATGSESGQSTGSESGQGAAPAQGGQAPAQGGAPAPGTQFGATAPPEQGLETRQFQDWQVRCGSPTPGAPEACEMIQQPQNDQGQTVLLVAIGNVPNNNAPGMLIILPLGISLPPGVVLMVDGGKKFPAEVARCERHGCEIELLLEPDVLSTLKAGREANVLFQIRDQQGQPKQVGVPFSLLGFTAALNEVTQTRQ